MDTACQVLGAREETVEPPSHDSPPQAQSRRDQIGQEVSAAVGVGKGDVMAVGRHHHHAHILALQLRATLAIHLLVGGEGVLGEHAAYDIGTLHVVVLKVHHHFVAYSGTEECAAGRGHRRDDAHPRRRHGIHAFFYLFFQFLAFGFYSLLLISGCLQVVMGLQVLPVLLVIEILILADYGVVLLRILIAGLALPLVVLLGRCLKFGYLFLCLFFLGLLFLFFLLVQ